MNGSISEGASQGKMLPTVRAVGTKMAKVKALQGARAVLQRERTQRQAVNRQPSGSLARTSGGTRAAKPNVGPIHSGDRIASFRIIGVLSDDSIHHGTHSEPGTFDITANEAARHGVSLEKVKDALINKLGDNVVVAIRKKGQRGIKSDHIHATIISQSPKEAQRLLGQLERGGDVWNEAKQFRSREGR